jgi:hypothetical protein
VKPNPELVAFAAIAASLAICCSDDNGGISGPPADAGTGTDADTDTDTEPLGLFDECQAGIGVGGAEEFFGTADEGGEIKYFWYDSLEEPTLRLDVEAYAEADAPTEPGEYPIGEAEADYATCGLCIVVHIDGGYATFMPMADYGSITLDSYSLANPVGSTFSGSFTAAMQEVEIASDFSTTPVEDGCAGVLTASWNGTVADFP